MKAILSLFLVVGLTVQAFPDERTPVAAGISGQEKAVTQNHLSAAEEYLSRLAESKRKQRTIIGISGCIVGASIAGLGIAGMSTSEKEDRWGIIRFFGTLGLAGGGVILVGAITTQAVPTQAERTWVSIRDIQDSAEREKLSAAALPRFAKMGRKSRMIRGGLITAAAVLTAGTDKPTSNSIIMASMLGGLALYTFLSKSAEEKAYLSYLESHPQKTSPELFIGFTPRGGVWVSLSVEL